MPGGLTDAPVSEGLGLDASETQCVAWFTQGDRALVTVLAFQPLHFQWLVAPPTPLLMRTSMTLDSGTRGLSPALPLSSWALEHVWSSGSLGDAWARGREHPPVCGLSGAWSFP